MASQIYKDIFSRPGALCYLTDSERRSCRMRFDRPLEDITAWA